MYDRFFCKGQVLGTNSSEAAELFITCQGLSADALVKLYVEGLGKL